MPQGAEAVTDILEIGKTYQFKVLKADKENKKVSIGYKQLQPQPWDLVDGKYNVGDIIHGKVVRIVPFGAFIEVEKGVDGLVLCVNFVADVKACRRGFNSLVTDLRNMHKSVHAFFNFDKSAERNKKE